MEQNNGFSKPKAQVERHGGDIWGASRSLNQPVNAILDLSASLNPLGPPPRLKDEICRMFDYLGHYPDRSTTELRAALAEFAGLKPHNILTGNGSTALISILARALNPASTVLVAPAFGEFTRALALNGRKFHFYTLSEQNDFLPTDHDLEQIWSSNPSCVIVTNPLSPSGALINIEWLDALFVRARQQNAWLIIDEAFMDFAPDSARDWAAPKVKQYNKFIVLRSMTKFYCMAGLRLGYLMTNEDVIAKLAPWGEPWSVNTLAQAAGEFCLKQDEYAVKSRKAVNEFRETMLIRLQSMGLKVFISAVNYLLMKLPDGGPNAAQVADYCMSKGVLVRDCSNFMGCNEMHLRTAVCGPNQQERLWAVLEPALKL